MSSIERFGLQRFDGSDKDIKFYTGFPNYSTLVSFFELAANQLNYWGSDNAKDRPLGMEKHGPGRKLKPIDELFLVLYKLRCDILEKDLGDRFGCDTSTISRIVTTWINFLYYYLKQLPLWASCCAVMETMPSCFRNTTLLLLSLLIVLSYLYRCPPHFVPNHKIIHLISVREWVVLGGVEEQEWEDH